MTTAATIARRLELGTAVQEPGEWPDQSVEPASAQVPLDVPGPREEKVQEVWDGLGTATFARATFGSLFDPRLLLKDTLEVEFEEEDGSFIGALSEFDMFGYGRTRLEALDDVRRSLAELYWTLKENQDNLAPGMQVLWARLAAVITER